MQEKDGRLKPYATRPAVLPRYFRDLARELWSDGCDTKEIADRLGQSEAAVYNGLYDDERGKK